jgi:hypothetical protein
METGLKRGCDDGGFLRQLNKEYALPRVCLFFSPAQGGWGWVGSMDCPGPANTAHDWLTTYRAAGRKLIFIYLWFI